MIDATRTTSTLLDALHNAADDAAWREFDGRYRPILISLARRAGLSDTDAADAAQDTLADFFRGYGEKRYDRSRGRLRQWLIGIARLKIADLHRARARAHPALESNAAQADLNTDDAWSSAWDAEQRGSILARALDQLRESDKLAPQTLRAFELVALRSVPAAQVAAELGLTTQEVYLAKSRCLERVRTLVDQLAAAYGVD